ncbi:MAG: helix-turn-helix domain-containing protein [Nanoarchaeota archaeon]
MKPKLVEKTSIYLLKKGFTIKILTRTCFDILARKDTKILLIKILEDANSISEEYATQMNHIASYINASSLIVAEKAGADLYDNLVYFRFGIYTLNFTTFKNSVENKFPFIKSDHGGPIAQILGDKIRQIREDKEISLGDISRRIGVSKKMIQRYEQGKSNITVNKALRIYDIFGHGVFEKINIFAPPKKENIPTSSDITKKFSGLGFEAIDTKKVPFDIIAKTEKDLILTALGDKPRPELESLSKLVDADKLIIFKNKKPKDVPSLTKKEFMDFEKSKELMKFLKEFD